MNALKLAWMIFMVMVLVSAISIGIVPSDVQVPVHWNINGEVDSVKSLPYALMMYLVIMFLMLGLIQGFTYFEPRKENLVQSGKAKGWIALAVISLLSIISLSTIAIAFGYDVPINRVTFVSLMGVFLIVGNFLSKTKSNFFIGIRTPWTLSSEENWRKTHRLGGRIFMLAALVGISLAFIVAKEQLVYLIFALIVPAALIPCIYSWYVWYRNDKQ